MGRLTKSELETLEAYKLVEEIHGGKIHGFEPYYHRSKYIDALNIWDEQQGYKPLTADDINTMSQQGEYKPPICD